MCTQVDGSWKYCPFCGKADRLKIAKVQPAVGPVIWSVLCTSCGTQGPRGSDADEAVAGWQIRRPTKP
jgi:hypothetical protein